MYMDTELIDFLTISYSSIIFEDHVVHEMLFVNIVNILVLCVLYTKTFTSQGIEQDVSLFSTCPALQQNSMGGFAEVNVDPEGETLSRADKAWLKKLPLSAMVFVGDELVDFEGFSWMFIKVQGF